MMARSLIDLARCAGNQTKLEGLAVRILIGDSFDAPVASRSLNVHELFCDSIGRIDVAQTQSSFVTVGAHIALPVLLNAHLLEEKPATRFASLPRLPFLRASSWPHGLHLYIAGFSILKFTLYS